MSSVLIVITSTDDLLNCRSHEDSLWDISTQKQGIGL